MISVAVRAIEDKLGIDSSADASTIDYKLKNPGSVDPGHRHTYATIVWLGTAATVDIGTTANKIIALDSFGKLPAVDGSQLINLPPHPLSGDVFGVPSGIVQDNELVLWSGIDGKHIKASGILSSTVASAIANAHSHANKALLDTYTQLDADIVSAVSLKHAHSNKAILDGIASAPVESVTSPDGSIVVTRVGNAVTVSSTWGGWQIIFDAIVAPTGWDYTKLSDAIAAGKKTIFYRKGTYVETDEIIITLDNTIIVGESWETYQIQQHPTGNNGIRIDGANNCIITNFTVDCEAFSQWSALQIIDGQPAGSPDATKGCNNTIFKMNLKGNQTAPLATGKFCLYLAGINATVDQATTEYDADRLCTGNQIIGCTMSSGYQGDAFVFGLQKNSRFEGNRCIGGRIAPYMLKNCSINNNEVIDSVSQGIALSFPSQNVDIAHNRIWNPAAQGVLTNNQLEHDFTTSIGNNITIHDNKIYSPGSNGIGVTGGTTKNLGVVSGAFISITDNQIFDGWFHGIYLQDINNFVVKNNIIRDVNTTNNSRGSGVYMVRNVKDGSIEGNIINDSRWAGALMRHSIASREGNTCTDNSIIGNKISGTYLDRNIWTDSDWWIIANNHIAGGKYAGVFFQNANKASVIGNYFKNNTNDANNAWGEVWINGTASNIIVDNNIFESNATNKAKYWVWVEAATSSGIQIGQNLFIGMQTANVWDSGTGTLYQVIAPKGTGSTKFLREDLTWQTITAWAAWWAITGTLSAQTDLQNALNAKQNALTNPITGTGTTQQIPYFIGSTNLTSDSRLFWDYTNYRLGIGTSSPAGNLHILWKDNWTASIRLEKTGTNAWVFQIYNDGFANIVGPGAGPNRRFAFYDQMGAGSWSEALPPFTNFGDLNTGMHFPSADTIGWSTDGVTRFTLNNTTAVFTGALSASNLSGTNTWDQTLQGVTSLWATTITPVTMKQVNFDNGNDRSQIKIDHPDGSGGGIFSYSAVWWYSATEFSRNNYYDPTAANWKYYDNAKQAATWLLDQDWDAELWQAAAGTQPISTWQMVYRLTTGWVQWLKQQAETPSDPDAGFWALYFKNDGKLYKKIASTETEIGGLSWGSAINWATGTGLALTMSNSYAAGGIGQSITMWNTQTQALIGLKIDTWTSAIAHTGLLINALGASTTQTGIKIDVSTGRWNAIEIILSWNTGSNNWLYFSRVNNTGSSSTHYWIYFDTVQNTNTGTWYGIYQSIINNSFWSGAVWIHQNTINGAASWTAYGIRQVNINFATSGTWYWLYQNNISLSIW
jgi:parallel beta-helix repeat protein